MRFQIGLGISSLAAVVNNLSIYSSKSQSHCFDDVTTTKIPIPIPIPMNNVKDVVIVKLGGSALTAKSSFETLRQDCLRVTADQIKAIANDRRDVQLLVAHGAGSFGHFQVSSFFG